MSSFSFSLPAYLSRLSLSADSAFLTLLASPASTPSRALEILRRVHFAHIASIPFENIDVLTRYYYKYSENDNEKKNSNSSGGGSSSSSSSSSNSDNINECQGRGVGLEIEIDDESIFNKLVLRKRGGYCFEQNNLLRMALLSLGFSVRSVLARSRWNKAADVTTPKTHLALIVTADGLDYLADVGFAGAGPLYPTLMPYSFSSSSPSASSSSSSSLASASSSSHVRSRVIVSSVDPDYYLAQWRPGSLNDEWKDLYIFMRTSGRSNVHHDYVVAAQSIDCQMSNWWSCTHPSARFTSCLLISGLVPGKQQRHHILNDEYVVYSEETEHIEDHVGEEEKARSKVLTREKIENHAAFVELLRTGFGLDIPASLKIKFAPV